MDVGALLLSLQTFFLDRWFEIMQTIGILGSLFIATRALRADTKSRRIENYINITSAHRDIWRLIFDRPELNRVRVMNIDLRSEPITPGERQLVLFVILHMATVFEAMRQDQVIPIEALKADIDDFLSFPIPNQIWQQLRDFQNNEFVMFVEKTEVD